MSECNGILLVDKPAGWTSFDVVAKIRGVLKKETGQKVKVGHTGTLDPFATGLLIIVVGSYTKKADHFSKLDKIYETKAILGQTSTTGDPEGDISAYSPEGGVKPPTEEQIKAVFSEFTGKISQIPPAFSAVKIDGQRAYKLARVGKEVKIEPRQVQIHELVLKDYKYPTLLLTASVSSGTYIRSLVEDIGIALGLGAYTMELNRSQIGQYKLEDAHSIDKITLNDIIEV